MFLAAFLTLPALAAPAPDPVRAAVVSVVAPGVPSGGDLKTLIGSFTPQQKQFARTRLDAVDRKVLPEAQVQELADAYRLLGESDAHSKPRAPATQGALLAKSASDALKAGRFEEASKLAARSLKAEPNNREALAVLHFAEGRSSSVGSAGGNRTTPATVDAGVATRTPQGLRLQPVTKFRTWAPPPDSVGDASTPSQPNPLPLLPLATIGLGAAAYGVYRSRGTYETVEGSDGEHPAPVGPGQRFVSGALMAGAAGAVIYLAGAALVAGFPAIPHFISAEVAHGAHILHSEAGAINPGEQKAINEVPKILARVVPLQNGDRLSGMLGKSGDKNIFVTAAEDIASTPAAELADRLGIARAPRYAIIRFPVQSLNIATPIAEQNNPLFIGRGLTSGGAREFFLPNIPIPSGSTFEYVEVSR